MYKEFHFSCFGYFAFCVLDTEEYHIDRLFRLEIGYASDWCIHQERSLFLDLVALFCGGYPLSWGYGFYTKKAFYHFQFLLGLRDPDINYGCTWTDYMRGVHDPLDAIPF